METLIEPKRYGRAAVLAVMKQERVRGWSSKTMLRALGLPETSYYRWRVRDTLIQAWNAGLLLRVSTGHYNRRDISRANRERELIRCL